MRQSTISMSANNYLEKEDSQTPALKLLQKPGYQCLSPEETERQRSGILSNVILEDVLAQKLAEINFFDYSLMFNQNQQS